MRAEVAAGVRGERAVGLLALWAAALALRPQVIVLGPLLADVMDDLRVSHAVAGLLSTIPILCMGVFAPLAPWIAGRVGASRGIGLSLAVIAVFGLVRLWPAGAWVVVVLTVVFYGANAWLPAYYVERGWSSPDAGRALAVFHLVPLFVTLPVAWLADRVGSRRAWLAGGGVVMVGAFLGVLWGAAHGWLWS